MASQENAVLLDPFDAGSDGTEVLVVVDSVCDVVCDVDCVAGTEVATGGGMRAELEGVVSVAVPGVPGCPGVPVVPG